MPFLQDGLGGGWVVAKRRRRSPPNAAAFLDALGRHVQAEVLRRGKRRRRHLLRRWRLASDLLFHRQRALEGLARDPEHRRVREQLAVVALETQDNVEGLLLFAAEHKLPPL